jgi:hypothetical protein
MFAFSVYYLKEDKEYMFRLNLEHWHRQTLFKVHKSQICKLLGCPSPQSRKFVRLIHRSPIRKFLQNTAQFDRSMTNYGAGVSGKGIRIIPR